MKFSSPTQLICGNKLGYMQAFVEYGIRHNTLGTEFKAWLEEEMGIKK